LSYGPMTTGVSAPPPVVSSLLRLFLRHALAPRAVARAAHIREAGQPSSKLAPLAVAHLHHLL